MSHSMIPSFNSVPYRRWRRRAARLCVRILTLLPVVSLTSCAYLQDRILDQCKTHAYVETVIEDYLTQRYQTGAPVRLGIIPFVVPANLTQKAFQYVGLGNQLAYDVHRQFLNHSVIPIVEVLNREDWPGKKDEFYTGNFGALSQAREAGYDLILVGIIDNYNPYLEATVSTKLIEVESGTTLWYGATTVHTYRRDYHRGIDYVGIEDRRPAESYGQELKERLSTCITNEILSRQRNP